MFNKIDRSHFYVAFISALIAAIFTSILSAVLPTGMQKSAAFSEITCTKLNVIDAGRNRIVSIDSDKYGGVIHVSGIGVDVKSGAFMYVDSLGGVVRLVDKDGEIHGFEDGKVQSFR